MIGKKEVRNKSTYKLLSFRISKYSTVKLDYKPLTIDFCDPYVILTYKDSFVDDDDCDLSSNFQRASIPYIDIFHKTGEPVQRINVYQILREHGLTMLNISQIKVPRLDWSMRQHVEQLEALAMKTGESEEDEDERGKKKKKTSILNLKKLTVVGMCHIGLQDESYSQY